MKRLVWLVLVLAAGFYGLWPAYSGFMIRSALEDKDAGLLESKIDFASLKESLRPAATAQADKMLTQALQYGGSGGLTEGLKQQLLPTIVDASLATIVTPQTLIRIYSEGGAVKDSVARIVQEQMGKTAGIPGFDKLTGLTSAAGRDKTGGLGGLDLDKLGGLLGKKKGAEAPAPQPQVQQTPYGLDNIKRFGLAGPLAIELGLAKDPAAKEPDVTVEMGFTGNDWKLTALRPRI